VASITAHFVSETLTNKEMTVIRRPGTVEESDGVEGADTDEGAENNLRLTKKEHLGSQLFPYI
jgi:hypothetical protein